MKKLLLSSSLITILVMGINFLFKIYLSYKISKEELGVFYTFMDIISVAIMFFSGFKDSLVVDYDKKNYEKVIFWYKRIFVILTIILLLIEIVYYNTLSFPYPTYFLILLFIVNSYMIYLSYLNASQKKYKIMLFENLIMALGLISGFFIASLFTKGVDLLFIGFLFAYIVRILYLKNFSHNMIKEKKCNFLEIKDFFKNSILSSLMYLFSGLFISLRGITFLYFYDNKDILSEYQVVVRSIFFSLVAIFVYPLNTFTFPHISKFIAERKIFEVERIEKKLIKYLIIFFFLLIISTFFTKYAIGLIFPISYEKSYKMLNLMLPFLPFIAYTTFALNIIKGTNRFDLALIVRIIGSVTFFIMFYIFYKLNFEEGKTLVFSLDSAFFIMFLSSTFYRKKQSYNK
jgi:O-antigen/teichoic acid export membrane protein